MCKQQQPAPCLQRLFSQSGSLFFECTGKAPVLFSVFHFSLKT